MRSGQRLAATLMVGLALSSLHPRPAGASSPELPKLAERYIVNGDKTQVVTVTRLARDVYVMVGKGWDGVGLLGGSVYWGVFRQTWGTDSFAAPGTRGTHRGLLRPDGTLAIHGEYTIGLTGSFNVVWAPEGSVTPSPAPEPDRLPALDEFVYVDELPEPLTKVPPEYPEGSHLRVEGTVIVQALVGRDGRVKDTRVIKSIPALDDAAVTAVRQWVFKPASAGGKPVAVWVAVPVRFVVH